MGKASSSKKVQRAARAAASSRGASERRELGFPLAVGLVVLIGVGLVVAARSSRDPLLAPRTSDHWHAAYTLYDCGVELPNLQGTADPDGIHSHQDGLIHIHPFNSSATGDQATVSVFLEAMNASITTEAISADEFGTVAAADGCGDEASVIKAARWRVLGGEGVELVEVFDSGFGDMRFESDGEAFTFARVPVGEDPPEPSAASLAQLETTTGGALISEGPVSFDDVVADTTTLAPVGDGSETPEPDDPAGEGSGPDAEDPGAEGSGDESDPPSTDGGGDTGDGDGE